MKNKVAIVGAGFSGLSLAWALQKRGINCEIFECTDHSGGMISSTREKILFESAANAAIASAHLEQLLDDLEIKALISGNKSNNRWIYRNKPTRMPLTVFELFTFIFRLVFHWFKGDLAPLKPENIEDWCQRVFHKNLAQYLITPALQGIYASEAKSLSAKIIIAGMFSKELKHKKGKLKGSVSAPEGMGQITQNLVRYLQKNKIKINYNTTFNFEQLKNEYSAVVVATSIKSASEYLKTIAPRASELMSGVPTVPLTTVVMGFKNFRKLKGFGCLFPRDQGFSALGVLFNSDIFSNRGELESETWIYSLKDKSADEILKTALTDREKLLKSNDKPEVYRVREWKNALPLYGQELLGFLTADIWSTADKENPLHILINGAQLNEPNKPIFLTGNYLGGIGLAKILDYNIRLASKIEKVSA